MTFAEHLETLHGLPVHTLPGTDAAGLPASSELADGAPDPQLGKRLGD